MTRRKHSYMRAWMCLIIIMLLASNVFAQFGNQQDQYQQQADQTRLRQMQTDLDIARMQAETDRMRQETQRMRDEGERDQKLQELNDLINSRAEQAKKAQDAADDLREETHRASVRAADLVYLAIAFLVPVLLGIYIVKKSAKDVIMKYEQKFGVVVMLCAFLIALLALAVSADWIPNLDALQNIFITLRIKLFPESDSPYSQHMIDIPTKYVLVGLAFIATYGFTTYLGISPAWKKSETLVDQSSVNIDPQAAKDND